MTLIVVSYDVGTKTPEGKRRLRKVAQACEDYGQRVQCSVFECWVDPAHITVLKNRLLGIIDPATDSLRFYYLGEHWRGRTEHFGSKAVHDPQESLIL